MDTDKNLVNIFKFFVDAHMKLWFRGEFSCGSLVFCDKMYI